MEHQQEQRGEKKIPDSLKEAVNFFIETGEKGAIIEYLKRNPDDIAEFCLQVVESYQEGDNSGIITLSGLIRELLDKK